MFTFRDQDIPVDIATPPKVDDFLKCPYFKEWVSDLAANPSFDLHRVSLQSLDYGYCGIRFAKFQADIEHDGVKVSGRCLLRGPAVVILVVLIDATTGEEYYLFVRQPRVSNGSESLEIIAGKMELTDESPRSAARRELEEEAGLTNIPDNELIDLSALAFGNTETGIVPAVEIASNIVHYFYYKAVWPIEKIREIDGQKHGASASEQITTRVVSRRELRTLSPDGKHFTALGLLRVLQEDGLLA
jgi:8-oxo-dGTP pyrophosphatase MutT (NUDIX family)